VTGITTGLVALLLRRSDSPTRGEFPALLCGTEDNSSNLVDMLKPDAVVDFLTVAPAR